MESSRGRTLPHAEPPQPIPLKNTDEATIDPLPIDREMGFDPELYPNEPATYEPLLHFYQRQKDPDRKLKREIGGYSAVRKTITGGEIVDNGDGCGCFIYEHDGVTFYVVVGFHLDSYRIAVSGWPRLTDARAARQSGDWFPGEIEEIVAFNEEHQMRHHRWSSNELIHA